VNAADLLAELASSIPPLPRAACRRHRQTFDSTDPPDVDRAIAICCGCVELEPCRRWSEAQPPRTLLGTVAGKRYAYNMSHRKKEN
jgi:hypothetical protein